MNYLRNIFALPGVLIHILRALNRQKSYVKAYIDPILEPYAATDLSKEDTNKIRWYYGNAVPAILGEGFSLLRGQPLNEFERLAMTYLGSITGLYDDFFDKFHTDENHILDLTTNPGETTTANAHENLFTQLWGLALHHSPDQSRVKRRAMDVYDAQIMSKQQKDSTLEYEKIKQITFLKGGASLLFYRSVLNEIPDEAEERLLYTLGSLMQLENDLFDIYKDYQDQIATLPTITEKVDNLRTLYSHLHDEVMGLLKKTKYKRKNQRYFARYINVVICRGYVCLDCLEQNEKHTDNSFIIKHYRRKQLICDMERPVNIIKAFKYYATRTV